MEENKTPRGGGLSMMRVIGASNHCEECRADGDYYATPTVATRLLCGLERIDVVKPGRKVIMFLKLTFAEGKARRDFFGENPPSRVWVSSSRLGCGKNGADGGPSAVAYAWWVWEKGYRGPTEMKWFN